MSCDGDDDGVDVDVVVAIIVVTRHAGTRSPHYLVRTAATTEEAT